MVGIFGGNDSQTRTITLFSIDSSLLQGAFNAKLAQNAVARGVAPTAAGSRGPDVIAPWDKPAGLLDLPDELGEHLSRNNLFAGTGEGLRSDLTKTQENLFRMWKGMKKMQALAAFAAEDKRADLVRGQLQKQFERYESEIFDFVAKSQLSGVKLIAGPLETKAETDARIPRSSSEYEGRRLMSSVGDAVPGLDSNTRFNINVTKSDGSVFDIAIDLADIGASKTLGNISEHINTQLEAAGVTTRFFTYGDGEGKFGLKVTRSILEEVVLTPVDGDAAVYVAGTSGNGEFAKGSVRKFTELDGAMTQAFDAKTEVEDGVSQIAASALGPNGELFVLGTTSGDIGGQVVGGEKDVFLTRYDAAGNEVWRRLVGSTDTAEGYGLAVSDDGSVAISGRANKPLTEASPDNGINSFVTLYDSGGEAQWTRHTGPQAVDAAFAVDFDADGNVVVAGASAGALSGQTHQGGQDAYVQRLSAGNGAVLDQIQFGDAGSETASAVRVANGLAYVAVNDDGQGVVNVYDVNDLAAGPTRTITVGGAGETTRISAIEVDGAGKIFVAGDTTDSTFTGAGTDGRLTHSGGADGFVARLDEASGSMDFGAYLGTAEADRIRGLAIASTGEIYVTGETEGDLDGNNLVGSRDGFISRMDANGAPQTTKTYSGINGRVDSNAIVIDEKGDSALTRLGLGHGNIGDIGSLTVTSTSAVRPGMSFSMAVDDGPLRRIDIEADDSIRWVAFQMNRVLGRDGLVEVKREGDHEYLRVNARSDSKISLRGGSEGFDALPGLGLKETDIFGPKMKERDDVFALGFGKFVNLLDFEAAADARDHMGFALKQIEKAFDSLTASNEDPLAKRRREALLERPPAQIQKQIANFQAALARLSG
ncbi:MAG: hypothetical protein TEF_07485 [Rhizobiales bacterium NRL2]|jgi:flagellin-like hook-associated protein FlgL|nr:MAG: hypothetical protein TEF_07485 [Rhizobiales bacterium NRL2]